MSTQQTQVEEEGAMMVQSLYRAGRIIVEIPQSVKNEGRKLREAMEQAPDFRQLSRTRTLIKVHQDTAGDSNATDEQIVTAVKELRRLMPERKTLSDTCKATEQSKVHVSRITQLRDEIALEKKQFEADYSSEVVQNLVKSLRPQA